MESSTWKSGHVDWSYIARTIMPQQISCVLISCGLLLLTFNVCRIKWQDIMYGSQMRIQNCMDRFIHPSYFGEFIVPLQDEIVCGFCQCEKHVRFIHTLYRVKDKTQFCIYSFYLNGWFLVQNVGFLMKRLFWPLTFDIGCYCHVYSVWKIGLLTN